MLFIKVKIDFDWQWFAFLINSQFGNSVLEKLKPVYTTNLSIPLSKVFSQYGFQRMNEILVLSQNLFYGLLFHLSSSFFIFGKFHFQCKLRLDLGLLFLSFNFSLSHSFLLGFIVFKLETHFIELESRAEVFVIMVPFESIVYQFEVSYISIRNELSIPINYSLPVNEISWKYYFLFAFD